MFEWKEINEGWQCEKNGAILKVIKTKFGFDWSVVIPGNLVGGFCKTLLKGKKLAEKKSFNF